MLLKKGLSSVKNGKMILLTSVVVEEGEGDSKREKQCLRSG